MKGTRQVTESLTAAEWQETADAAQGLRVLASAGAITTSAGRTAPLVQLCTLVLQEARARGIYPSRPDAELAGEIFARLENPCT